MRLRPAPITITEEGEAIGTLQQFARGLNLSLSALRSALETEVRDCVIFRAGPEPNRLLILDACGLPSLLRLAQSPH
ncbi:MAG: hypothetical protein ACLFTE_08970 [Salinivenus sp.]